MVWLGGPAGALGSVLESDWLVLGALMATTRVLFWLVPALLMAFLATETRCFGEELQCPAGTHDTGHGSCIGDGQSAAAGTLYRGTGPGTIEICTAEHPCISDDAGPTEMEVAYICGAARIERLYLEARHARHLPQAPKMCADLDAQYGSEVEAPQ